LDRCRLDVRAHTLACHPKRVRKTHFEQAQRREVTRWRERLVITWKLQTSRVGEDAAGPVVLCPKIEVVADALRDPLGSAEKRANHATRRSVGSGPRNWWSEPVDVQIWLRKPAFSGRVTPTIKFRYGEVAKAVFEVPVDLQITCGDVVATTKVPSRRSSAC
jgi:hypothetical protein